MIIVAGESLVDLIVEPSLRLSAIPGGGPYNTARTLARLGSDTAFLGRCSTDRFGRDALSRLAADGVRLEHVEQTGDPTTLAIAELDDAGTATYRFHAHGTAAAGLSESALAPVLAARPSAVHVGTLGLVLEPLATTVERLVERVDADTLVMLDVNARPTATPDPAAFRERVRRLSRRADVLKVSVDDLAFLLPDLDPDAALDRVATSGPTVVLRTDGAAPLVIAISDRRSEVPIPVVPVVDSVGAGDAFGGGFLHAWMRAGLGRDALTDEAAVRAAAIFGIRVAALTVGRIGAEPPYAAALEGDA